MKRRTFSLVLAICVMLTMMPAEAFAASGTTTSGKLIVSDKSYEIAPDITEREYITNNTALSEQQIGYVLEVKLGENAEIVTGYNDYNIENIKSGNGWGMKRTREQAQAVETIRDVNVVCAVNGDFFDMSNGRPLGTLIMNGETVQRIDGPCFYIDKDGKPHIADWGESIPNDVKEAVGGQLVFLRNGRYTGNNDGIVNPRTAVGIKADGTVILFTVDGRQAPLSVGMHHEEMAQTMADLGCVDGLCLDGGGSATFATQRAGDVVPAGNNTAGLTVRNNPSDGYERTVSSTLMVISTSQADGVFDRAILSPKDEIYTPGSTVQFEAVGADKSGASVSLPETGLSWSILKGESLGTIDAQTGTFTGAEGAVGEVTVALKHNGETVGTASVELRWPDKLKFANASISLDFGETSELSFSPTYQGRAVNYKNGDFKWAIDIDDTLSYKYSVPIEIYTKPGWGGYDQQLMFSVTGKLNETREVNTYYSDNLVYTTKYEEISKSIETLSDGSVQVSETIKHKGATLYSHANGTLLKDNITSDTNSDKDGQVNGTAYKVSGIQPERNITFSLGKFSGNSFTADENTSFRGNIRVSLPSDESVYETIEVVVGMEPVVLMDFEDGHKDPITGETLSAKEYWTMYLGNSKDLGGNQLSIAERKQYRLHFREGANNGYAKWNTELDGKKVNCLKSYDDNEEGSDDRNVRFGQYALNLSWDLTSAGTSANAAADFGFSSAIYVHVVQPTKIGFWINVPKELKNDPSLIKMIFVGGIDSDKPDKENENQAYYDMDSDGNLTWKEGKVLSGTTQYLEYHSYDSSGKVTGSQLKDWAGKGWTWIEADVSNAQFPIGLQLGYTIRIVSPPNYTKTKGDILIDNMQLIYGTNTNDINKPVIESIVERSGAVNLKTSSGTSKITSVTPKFDIQINDSKKTDKYASGIDNSAIRIDIDGYDCTSSADITTNVGGDTSVMLQSAALTNGQHTISVKVKDFSGNETTESYTFTVDSREAADVALKVEAQEENPIIGRNYVLNIVNLGDSAAAYTDSADVTISVDESYGKAVKDSLSSCITYGDGYEEASSPKYSNGKITIHLKKKDVLEGDESYAKIAASLALPIPADTAKGTKFGYTVSSGRYTVNSTSMTFAQAGSEAEITAKYDVSAGQAIVGYPVTFNVTDESGQAVQNMTFYTDGNPIGSTHTFDTAGKKVVYAQDADGYRSWCLSFIVNDLGGYDGGYPFGIQNNASDNGSSEKSITWLAAIGGSDSKAYVKLSESADALDKAENTAGASRLFTFTEAASGNAYRLNEVKLTGLKAETTYYYKVGDGTKWSDAMSFTTAPQSKDAETNFFVLADIQTNDTTNLNAAVSLIKNSTDKYSFGIQTGDAIDNVNQFANWSGLFTTMNSATLGGIDVFHTLGNHEYYGDEYGDVAGSIFSVENHTQGGYYSAEYGSVYVGVLNDGGDILSALAEAKEDAQSSKCAWKVLVMHQPIYGTESFMEETKRLKVVQAIEEAGFDVVFSGDDHAYARTYPMKQDRKLAENSRDGVVYYVCGDLSSKDNEYHDNDIFKKMIPHNEYRGMYMSVKAEKSKMTLTAYKYDGTLLDSYTIAKTDCELGNHKFGDGSIYDAANKTVNSCTVCGEDIPVSESGYTGMLSVKDSEDRVVLAAGELKTGWFVLGDEIYHAGNDGILHNSTTHNTATCLKDGYIYAKCTCGAANYQGANTYRTGHSWNDDYQCTVCGAKGKNIENVKLTLNGKSWEYTGKDIKPSVTAKDGTYTLVARSDAYGTDAYKSYKANVNVGYGTVVLEGRGDYYGTTSIKFPIVPQSVENVTVGATIATAVTLNWEPADGAQYYQVYQKTGSGAWKEVGKTEECGMVVSGLKPNTKYYFRVITCADIEGEILQGLQYSEAAEVTTLQGSASDSADLVNSITGIISGSAEDTQTIRTTKTEDDKLYLLLPSYADLTDISLKFESRTAINSITLLGTKESADVDITDDKIKVNVEAMSNKTENGEYKLYISANGANPIELFIMKSSSVSAVYLSSDDAQNKGREYVDASKSNKTTGTMLMMDKDGNSIYSGALTQIKARGNSTFKYYPKKSYQIKLADGTDLLGCGESVKTWVLLAGYGDATQMHDKLFKDLAAELGMLYTASCDWIDLYYDGEYRGTYLLSEKNSVGETGINITDMEALYEALNSTYGENMTVEEGANKYEQKIVYTKDITDPENITGGYLIELNASSIDEANGFYTRKGKGFNVKSPEYMSQAAMQYISEYYQEFEDAVYAKDENGNYTGYNAETGKYYYDYCDRESLVQAVLLQQLALNPDGFIASVYFYKDADGKMYTGPIWDHELVLGTGFTIKIDPSAEAFHYLEEALIKIPDFKDALEKYYNETFKDSVNSLTEEGGTIDVYYETIKDSTKMNYLLWPYIEIGSPNVDGHLWAEGTDYEDVIADMNDWLEIRAARLEYIYGDETAHTEHKYKSKIISEATYTEEGLIKYTCSICGHSYSETIDKLTAPSGGGGGGAGGFVVPPAETEKEVSIEGKNENGEKFTYVTVKTETSKDENGSTVTEIEISSSDAESIIKNLKDNESVEIVIKSGDSNKTSSDVMRVKLPKKLLSSASTDKNADSIRIEDGERTLELSKDIIDALAEIKSDEAVLTAEFKDGNADISISDGNTTYVLVGKNTDKLYEKVELANRDGLTEIVLMEKSEAEDLLTKQGEKLEKMKAGVRNTTIKLISKRTSKGISLAWTKSKGYKVDGFQVYRSVKKNSGYGKKAFFTANNGTKSKYTNTKGLKTGNTYYYKVRGFRVVDGVTVYTKWSNKAYRSIK